MKNLLLQPITILIFVFPGLTNAQWYSQINPEPNHNLYDVFAIDEMTSIAVGESNTILKTTDGGDSWENKSSNPNEYRYYTSVQFINNSTGWIAGGGSLAYGGASRILKSTDGGENWVGDSIGTGGLNAVYFIDANNGWAVGITGWDVPPSGCGMMFKSIDGGINWSPQYGASDPLWFVFFINQNIGWVGGSPGCGWYNDSTVYQTTDGGINWNVQYNGNYSLKSCYFINEYTGWIVGSYWNGSSNQGIILKTTDGGETWVSQLTGLTNYLYGIYFTDTSFGWVVGSGGVILKTTDGGNSWFSQESGTINNLYSVHFVDENTGWIVGDNGTILKTTNGGGTVPVELTSFTATAQNNYVELNWTSVTEINNRGFEVQRSTSNSEFVTVGFVEGNGTTTEEHHYTFMDKDVSGFLRYRLKQVDFDGSFEYSDIVDVEVLGNVSYELAHNYPNPFNPITNISYTLPAESQVKLSIYNPLGEVVEIIVNEKQDAGKYDAIWNAGNHPSGVYIYTLDAISLNGSKQMKISKKMILIK